MSFTHNDWSTIKVALFREAGELAASEARRTGGRGYASGGVARHVHDLHRINDHIKVRLDAANAESSQRKELP